MNFQGRVDCAGLTLDVLDHSRHFSLFSGSLSIKVIVLENKKNLQNSYDVTHCCVDYCFQTNHIIT